MGLKTSGLRTSVAVSALLALAGCAGGQSAADFNDDGFADIAIGAPFMDNGDAEDSGAVILLYGDPGAGQPTAGQASLLRRLPASEEPGPDQLKAVARKNELFGAALASADFDRDGRGDLAIGAPYEDIRGLRDAGTVTLVYGRAGGLDAAGADLWHQDRNGIEGEPEDNDLFGYALATGDFNSDGYPDLAIGAPFDNADGVANGGAVNVLYGSLSGLTIDGDQIWTQSKLGIKVQRPSALFGSSLATADFNGDGVDDLAVGAPDESYDRFQQAGAVSVIYGASQGLSNADSTTWRQSDRYVKGGDLANDGDRFGSALAAGDFNGDGLADLAIGTPLDDWAGASDAGTVNVLYAEKGVGIDAERDQIWHQNRQDTGLTNGARHNYGSALSVGDFNGDGYADLAVGIPGQAREANIRVGAVHVVYGSPRGLTAASSQIWQQGLDGIPGTPATENEFGGSLSTLDANGDGYDDLLVGAMGDPAGAQQHAGGVYLILGGAGGLSGQGSRAWHEDTVGLGLEAQADSLFGAATTGVSGLVRVAEPAMEDDAMGEPVEDESTEREATPTE